MSRELSAVAGDGAGLRDGLPVHLEERGLGSDSIDIVDGLNPSLNPSLNPFSVRRLPKRVLNPSLNHFSIQRLPKRVLNLVLNPSLNF